METRINTIRKNDIGVIAFYISNHGYGHACRNVPIIKTLLSQHQDLSIIVKTDTVRADVMRQNLTDVSERILFFENCKECGLPAVCGGVLVDVEKLKSGIENDIAHWNAWIEAEKIFLCDYHVKLIVSDITPWIIKAAAQLELPSILITNFTWVENYQVYLDEKYWKPYQECYSLAEHVILYDFFVKGMENYSKKLNKVSLVMRDPIPEEMVEGVAHDEDQPLVFVSFGASIDLKECIQVSHLPYRFIVTAGTGLLGSNVTELPPGTVNTMSYIAISDYVISKCGWSTLAEILLNHKPCALIPRGDTPEDRTILEEIEKRGQGIGIRQEDFSNDLERVISKLKILRGEYDRYRDDREKIIGIIMQYCKPKVLNRNETAIIPMLI